MHSLNVIKSTCTEALAQLEDGEDWMAEYCSIVDPTTVIEMAHRIEQLERLEHAMSVEELRALGELVRDLTGYIRLSSGDKPDPVRDDLLLHARQLLGLSGI